MIIVENHRKHLAFINRNLQNEKKQGREETFQMHLPRFMASRRRIAAASLAAATTLGLTACGYSTNQEPPKIVNQTHAATPSPQETKKQGPQYTEIVFQNPITDARRDTQTPEKRNLTASQLKQEGLTPLQILDNPEINGKTYRKGIVLNNGNPLSTRIGYKAIKAMLQKRDPKKQSPARLTINCKSNDPSSNITAQVLKEKDWKGNVIIADKEKKIITVYMPFNKGLLKRIGKTFANLETGSGLVINGGDLAPLCGALDGPER
jgi:hypothetical protein